MIRYTEKLIYIFLIFLSLSAFAGPARVGDKDALIIIDMQSYFITRGGNQDTVENKRKVQEITQVQIAAIKVAIKSQIPIVFLEYEGFGETNQDLKKAIGEYEEVKYLLKDTDGMFDDSNRHKSKLVEYLNSKEIGNLIITGANGGACVQQSIEGSLKNNFNVMALNTGIADFNYKEFIYPYTQQYNFKPTCADCKFREVDGVAVVALELAVNQRKNNEQARSVNDSNRGSGKSVPDVIRSNDQQKSVEGIAR